MELMTKEAINRLTDEDQGPCLSMFAPLETGKPDTRHHNKGRIIALLRDARDALSEAGIRDRRAAKLLAPIEKLAEECPFWEHASTGIAIFRSPRLFEYFRLPCGFEQQLHLGEWFHLKPLIPLLSRDGVFYVLALSQKQVRLIGCSDSGFKELEVPGIAAYIAELAAPGSPEQHFQMRPLSRVAGRASGSVIHRQGDVPDRMAERKHLSHLVHLVERAVARLLHPSGAPLVLAAVEELASLYRQVNTHPGLLPEGLRGSPDRVRARDLREKALPLVETCIRDLKREARAKYEELRPSGRATAEVKRICAASVRGNIRSLFVDLARRKWGTFDRRTGDIEPHETYQPGDRDLVEQTAVETYLRDGKLWQAEAGELPDGACMAAIFRAPRGKR